MSSAKHFLVDPDPLVLASLRSLTLTNPGLALDEQHKIVYRRPRAHGGPPSAHQQVSLVSGGGSGHEPAFAGYVGPGLLSAAVAGSIFASPSAEQVRTAVLGRVDNATPHTQPGQEGARRPGTGVLVIVMNYTGDILNFGMGVEKARAAGVNAEMLVVADDAGVGRAAAGKVGRRGIAGTVLVVKICGALAARGADLETVAKVGRLVAANLVSVGASLERVHVPGRDDGDREAGLGRGEVEIGMGIHNEPGAARERLALPELVGRMLAMLLDRSDGDRAFLNVNSNEVVLLVNNLGGVSPLELGGVTAEAARQLERHWGIVPVRVLAGTYMTSLNGPGFSLTLLNVVNTDIGGPGMVQLLDAPAEATGWSAPVSKLTWEAKNQATRDGGGGAELAVRPSGLKTDPAAFRAALEAALRRVVAAEPEVMEYDTVVGDGDCGVGMKRGAEGTLIPASVVKRDWGTNMPAAILKHLSRTQLSGDVVVDVAHIVPIIEQNMDGTSGALYAIFMNALVHSLRVLSPGTATAQVWAGALKQACDALSKYTPARPGDRTLVDALYPFVDVLGKTADVGKAAAAAKMGAEGTRGIKASLGRSVYVGGTGFEKVPDPGAWALACFFLGLAGLKPAEDEWETL